MRLFDSHCHLDMEPLVSEQEAVIERAFKAGVVGIINIGSSMRGSKASIVLAEKYPNIWASVGLHPHDAETTAIDELRALTENDNVVAIGEIGLDYFNLEDKSLIEKQKDLFLAQLMLAREQKLPVVIHTRDAENDTIKILKGFKLSGVVHCYTGSVDFSKKLIELGYHIGFTGFVTFEQEKFENIRKVARAVPIDKLLLETDAPFLAPEPHRGKPNEPAYVLEVAKKIAELKSLSVVEVAEKTYENTKKLFAL
jgi:TatD DNase family protein